MIDALASRSSLSRAHRSGYPSGSPIHNPICPLGVNANAAFRGKRGRGDNDRASKKYR